MKEQKHNVPSHNNSEQNNISVDITAVSELKINGQFGVVKKEGRLVLEVSPEQYREFARSLRRKGLLIKPISKGKVKVVTGKQSEYNALRKAVHKRYGIHSYKPARMTRVVRKKGGIVFPKPSGDTNEEGKKGEGNGNK